MLDDTDKAILTQLQRNCRLTVAEISDLVSLSKSACHRRIKAMEEDGLISSYVARLEPRKLGYSIQMFVEISLATQAEDAFEQFEKAVRRVPEILECYLVGGQYDYLLRVIAADSDEYERIHRMHISRLPGVTRIQSSLSLRTVKAGWALPLE
jgi:DNA-binding Lrp family transcriptional regulator